MNRTVIDPYRMLWPVNAVLTSLFSILLITFWLVIVLFLFFYSTMCSTKFLSSGFSQRNVIYENMRLWNVEKTSARDLPREVAGSSPTGEEQTLFHNFIFPRLAYVMNVPIDIHIRPGWTEILTLSRIYKSRPCGVRNLLHVRSREESKDKVSSQFCSPQLTLLLTLLDSR